MIDSTQKFTKGFTLLEVLIATSIFSLVMVMTTGIISQSSGSQSKIAAIRVVSDESRNLSDTLSRDLRSANGVFKAKDSAGDVVEFKNGVALVDCHSGATKCKFVNDVDPTNVYQLSSDYPADALIIAQTDNDSGEKIFKIYSNGPTVGTLPYSTVSLSAQTLKTSDPLVANGWYIGDILQLYNADGTLLIGSNASQFSTDNLSETTINFSGYTASDVTKSADVQSYISYFINTKTKDYDNLQPTARAETSLRSMVTVRNYSK